ncbi:MAG: nitroreductase family protein [Actinomycetota bacterium]|nr:nitroreductase family protein [Actinomycetota bacterium]
MDAYLAVASKRDWRKYSQEAVPEDVVARIVDAGRLAGSAGNRQPWRFVVIERRALVEALAETVYEPENVLGATLVVAVVVRGRQQAAFDGGRAVQNMFLAAWNEGVASCPNGLRDVDRASELLAVHEDERPLVVLSFGYRDPPLDVESRSAEEWSRRANRKPLAELVQRL